LAAKAAGKLAIVELATAHVTGAKHYLGEEAERMPQWADSIDNLTFSPAYEARLEAEPQVADRVVAASAFTKQTLLEAGIAASKIDVLPLGFDVDHVPYKERMVQPTERPFRLLYAGNVTQRKGMSYLLEAMRLLAGQNITLDVIGTIQGSGAAFKAEERYYNYKPAVSQHELFQLYGQYDALVLPTLFEGFGLVLVEAMAAGLPIITTAHSIGPDLVEQWKNGAIVPIRDSQALAKAISHFAELEPEAYLATRRAARATSLSFTWDAYAARLGPYLAGLKL
jgi:glycosyltransferase involved in cell wall biosynthesis